ncbi:ATP-grasp domain-containing protein [Hyunsoonleella sp. 2307UL5-6]|uniref:ATP-grasp domain-containing protein n=1 Tax=Hyunsoonleella sp. 2307UL5-6 TaxID=3384768 RepID=UPI0039BC8C4F
MNILFTCAGRRNYLLKYFKEALNGKGKIIAVDNDKYAAASVDADVFIKVPNIYDDNYIDKLEEIVKAHNVNALISLNDLELPIISKHKNKLETNGVKVLVSDYKVIETVFDKWKTHKFITSLGLKSPKTYNDYNVALKDIEAGVLNYPLILKPRFGSGSIGVEVCDNLEELELVYKLLTIRIKKSIFGKSSSLDNEHSILIQEKLDGIEFGFDILNDFKGDFFATSLREKIAMRFGETDKAKSVLNTSFNTLANTIGNKLNHIGTMDGDAFLIGKDWYILELNPRFGGGYPFSHEAGANAVSLYIDWLIGNETTVNSYTNYKAGMVFSKCDRLIKIS